METKGVLITLVIDVPDLASVRYERDVLDMISDALPWDRLPEGTKIIQLRKMHYTNRKGVEPDGS